jgi:hypothetical protein
MKKLLLTVAVALMIAFPAFAEDAKPIPPAPPAPQSLTMGELINASQAIKQLNTYTVMSKAGDPIQLTYRFDATVLLAMIDITRDGDVALEKYQKTYNALVHSMSGGKDQVPKENFAEFNAQVSKLMQAPSGVIITKIKESALKFDVNPIPPAILSALLPIIEK